MQLFEKLIDHHEAVRLVLENVPRLPVARVPLMDAQGLTLGEDVRARFDSPPFDNSAMTPLISGAEIGQCVIAQSSCEPALRNPMRPSSRPN